MAVGACPFQGNLVLVFEHLSTRAVAAHQCLFARADNEFIGWVIAAAFEDNVMHGGKNVAFINACFDCV